MLNKSPIFVNGFQRGGTNILINLVSSHPSVQTLGAEVHQIFYGHEQEPLKKWVRRFFYAPVFIAARRHVFWPYRLYERDPLAYPVAQYIDLLLYWNKITARNVRYRNGSARLSFKDKAWARMACKCVNGVVLATPIFAHMYPDATFIALVRNGLALCEGFMRRGWSAERIGRMYQTVCERMIYDADHLENYHIVRFEDLLADPVGTTGKIYEYAGLNVNETKKFRLQAKKSMDKTGRRSATFGSREKETQWCNLEDIGNYLRKDVNENQIARLSERDKAEFLQYAHASMSHFGYLS